MAPYESQILFTLDTICPWTYIAKKRLDRALAEHARSPSADKVVFTLRFLPYQLHPDLPEGDQDRWAWLRDTQHAGSEEQAAAESARLVAGNDDLVLRMTGSVANTLEAHRVLHRVQDEHGPRAASLLVDTLFGCYFADGASPSAETTLLAACVDAGLTEAEAAALVVGERGGRGLDEVRRTLAEQRINKVDSVPTVSIEGRRRDITLVGAKDTAEYSKTIQTIVKESS